MQHICQPPKTSIGLQLCILNRYISSVSYKFLKASLIFHILTP